MDNLAFLAPLLLISGVAVIVLVAVAIVQDMKQDRKYGYRQAFYTIIALVMLVMAAGSAESLLVTGAKQVLPAARSYSDRNNMPPSFFLSGDPTTGKMIPGQLTYTCSTGCDFTAADKDNFSAWKASYQSWRDTSSLSLQTRRNIAGSLALLIISLPLYYFFARMMNRGAAEEYAIHPRTSPLRSVYFYGVSFAGLITAVVGGAFLLNTLLSSVLHTSATTNYSNPVSGTETAGIDSVIACGAKCNFTSADLKLAAEWKTDWQSYRDKQTLNVGSTQNDLANTIPLVLIGLPLFWFHFARIRKETQTPNQTPTPTHV